MFPPTHAFCPPLTCARLAISPTKAVAVVLPADPVIPIVFALTVSRKSCESLVSGMPCDRLFEDGEREGDAPGNK